MIAEDPKSAAKNMLKKRQKHERKDLLELQEEVD